MTSKKSLDALQKLMSGNAEYLSARRSTGDISLSLRERLVQEGQKPWAVVVACSDSRVVPEDIFMCNLGDICTIRVAGNVIGDTQKASILYAVEHLGVSLIMVLGHTHCGAVGAVLDGADDTALSPLMQPIAHAIGEETDPDRASALHTMKAAEGLLADPTLGHLAQQGDLLVQPALYYTETGRIEVLR